MTLDTNLEDKLVDILLQFEFNRDTSLATLSPAINKLKALIQAEKIAELGYILHHSSGGGDWRRTIIERIKQFREDS